MGGFGSGRWRERKEVVEECLFVAAADVPPFNFGFEPTFLSIRDSVGDVVGRILCKTEVQRNGLLTLAFNLRIDGQTCPRLIPLDNTTARNDGYRPCFLCPIVRGETFCGAKVRKLYVPPGSLNLGCRDCHQLSYSSSQRRRERLDKADDRAEAVAKAVDDLLSRVEAGEGVSFDEVIGMWRRASFAFYDLWESLKEQYS